MLANDSHLFGCKSFYQHPQKVLTKWRVPTILDVFIKKATECKSPPHKSFSIGEFLSVHMGTNVCMCGQSGNIFLYSPTHLAAECVCVYTHRASLD